MGGPIEANIRQEDLIDTNLLVDALRRHGEGRTFLETRFTNRACISVVTVAEIWAGADDAGREAAEAILSGFRALSVDHLIAKVAGSYRKSYGPSQGLKLPDALIAATAKVHNLRLVTRDRKHFPMRDINIWVPY